MLQLWSKSPQACCVRRRPRNDARTHMYACPASPSPSAHTHSIYSIAYRIGRVRCRAPGKAKATERQPRVSCLSPTRATGRSPTCRCTCITCTRNPSRHARILRGNCSRMPIPLQAFARSVERDTIHLVMPGSEKTPARLRQEGRTRKTGRDSAPRYQFCGGVGNGSVGNGGVWVELRDRLTGGRVDLGDLDRAHVVGSRPDWLTRHKGRGGRERRLNHFSLPVHLQNR